MAASGNGMADRLEIKPVDRSTWPDLERLFESKGGPKYCWCMAWRADREERKHSDGASRKAFLKARVDAGIPVGILAFAGGEPVAWCSVAPKETYRRLDDLNRDEPDERIWSIVCFFIRRAWRGRRLTPALVQAAIGYAQSNGATMVEAYPVDPESHSYRFMGFVPMFQALGFTEIGMAGSRRHVMRRRV